MEKKNFDFEIKKLDFADNKQNFQVVVKISMDEGWIKNPSIIIRSCNKELWYKLKHQCNVDGYAIFKSNFALETSALYHYGFSYEINDERRYILNKDKTWWKLSVNYEVPDWTKGKVIYHVFVDRFSRSQLLKIKEMRRRHIHQNWDEDVVIGPDEEGIWNNDFYGGNLQGIIDKLDYIKSLGISILYLSPIVYSQSTHRYDTSDYEVVDPYLGNNDDLKRLCDEAHKREMKVILDAVFNHTGNDSKYFNEYGTFDTIGAYQSNNSPYREFYRYNDKTGQVDYWWGMTNLPVCNGYSKSWQEYITGEGGIIDQWFALGIDGLRLDVADELTDEFIELIRVAVKRNKEDGFILGEVWKNPMRMNRGYLASGKGMDTVMNYNLMSSIIKYIRYGDAADLAEKIREIRNEYPDDAIFSAMNFTSTHDMTRGINLWDKAIFNLYGEWPWNLINDSHEFCKCYKLNEEQYEEMKQIYMVYVFLLTFMPGNLSVFYGDEVGLQGIGNLKNRGPFPWGKEDNKLLDFFRFIGDIRKREGFMETADLRIIEINENYIIFERNSDKEKLLVAINRTDKKEDLTLPSDYQDTEVTYCLKNSQANSLEPYGGIALKYKEKL